MAANVEHLLTLSASELGALFNTPPRDGEGDEDPSAAKEDENDTESQEGEENEEEEELASQDEDDVGDEDEVRSLQADDVVTSDTDDEDLHAPATVRSTNYIIRLCVTKQALVNLVGSNRIYDDKTIIALAQAYVHATNQARNARSKRKRDTVATETDGPSSTTAPPTDDDSLPQSLEESIQVIRTQIFRADKLMRGASLDKVTEYPHLLLLAYALNIDPAYGNWDFASVVEKTHQRNPDEIPILERRLKSKAVGAIEAQAQEIHDRDLKMMKIKKAETLARRAERAERRAKILALVELRETQESQKRQTQDVIPPTPESSSVEKEEQPVVAKPKKTRGRKTREQQQAKKAEEQQKPVSPPKQQQQEYFTFEEVFGDQTDIVGGLPFNNDDDGNATDDSFELVVEGLDEPLVEAKEKTPPLPAVERPLKKEVIKAEKQKPKTRAHEETKEQKNQKEKKERKQKKEKKENAKANNKPKGKKSLSFPAFRKKYPDFSQPANLRRDIIPSEFHFTGDVVADTKTHIMHGIMYMKGGGEDHELLNVVNECRKVYGYPYLLESLEEMRPFVDEMVARGALIYENGFVCITL